MTFLQFAGATAVANLTLFLRSSAEGERSLQNWYYTPGPGH